MAHNGDASWRCPKSGGKKDTPGWKFCPPEGCPVSYGCAREKGWKLGDPTPEECKRISASNPTEKTSVK